MKEIEVIDKLADLLFKAQAELNFLHPDMGQLGDRGRSALQAEIKIALQEAEAIRNVPIAQGEN